MRCAAVAFVLFAACAQSVGATARVPHPLGAPATAATDVNYELDIEIRDIKNPEGLAHEEVGGVLRPFSNARAALMPSYIPARIFHQAALLDVRSPDEVRVDLLLTSEWRELARLDGYTVELRDDRGELVAPQDVEQAAERHKDYEGQYQAWKNFQTVKLPDGGVWAMWAPESYYVSERVWRGGGAVVFRRNGLVGGTTRSLTLTLHNSARTLRFTWIFDRPHSI
jgi:hypothetical protein